MATVITNLLSAIPIFGHDLVEFNNLKNKLPTIGKISVHAFKKGNKKILNKEAALRSIPYSFLSMLVGLIDGDGYILIHKTTKGYIKINLTIAINIRDLSILQYIYSVLKLGKITVYSKLGICKLIINKTELQDVLFPLFLYHKIFFLTNSRRDQFNKAMFIFQNELKYFSDIKNIIPLSNSVINYTFLPFFKNWIVGFTMKKLRKYPEYIEYMKNNFYNDILKYKKNKNICDKTKSYLRKYIKTNRNNIKLFLSNSRVTLQNK